YKSVSAKFSDHDIDLVSALDMSALVREQHPIRLSCLRRAALPELSYFIHQWHHQLHMRLLIDQGGLDFLVIEHLRLGRVQYLISEPYHFAGFCGLHREPVNSPHQAVIRACSSRKTLWTIVLLRWSRFFRAYRRRSRAALILSGAG